MTFDEARAVAARRSERVLIALRGELEAYCVIEYRAHRRWSSGDGSRSVYTASRAPKRYEVLRGCVVVATPPSYEAALAAWEALE